MPEELTRGAVSALYLTFAHNQLVIAYFAGLALSAGISLFRPSRYSFLLFLGFLLLIFNYEFDKHVSEALRIQTTNAVILDPGRHLKAQSLIKLTVSQLLPVFLYTAGWGMIFMALIIGSQKSKKS